MTRSALRAASLHMKCVIMTTVIAAVMQLATRA